MYAILPSLHPLCMLVNIFNLIRSLSTGKQELRLKNFSIILAGRTFFLWRGVVRVVRSLGRQLYKKAGSTNTSGHCLCACLCGQEVSQQSFLRRVAFGIYLGKRSR